MGFSIANNYSKCVTWSAGTKIRMSDSQCLHLSYFVIEDSVLRKDQNRSKQIKTRLITLSIIFCAFLNIVFGIWYLVFGIWYLVFGICYLVFGIWYLVFRIKWLQVWETYMKVSMIRESSMHALLQIKDIEYHNVLKRIIEV